VGDLFPDNFDETEAEAISMASISDETHFRTNLNFLRSHNGIRKNKMHFLIAPTHAGKSTLTRTLLRDLIFNNQDKKILILLSEETKNEFKQSFYDGVPAGEHLKNVKVSSQVGVDDDVDKLKHQIEEMIDYYGIDIMIFDNLTTSKNLYMDESIGTQAKTASWLKDLCRKTTVFVIAHTNTDDYNNRLLSENDIRGGKTVVNMTEFLYVMQPIHINNSLIQFILIKKHRGQRVDHKFFKLHYKPELLAFSKDTPEEFSEIVRLFRLRNKL
jgi:GTPase SAR1 family protein